MFEISKIKLNHEELAAKLNNPKAGAMVFFDGRVRNHNDGQNVNSLEYQCYEEMALKEGKKIVEEALRKFEVHDAFCVHREGHLKIEEVAVWVGVCSSHRREAFEACQYIIDEVKDRVPMWKKEHYVEGQAVWVECHRCSGASEHAHV
ncbi:MAG: hypothetical protein CME70_02455 [Halobacteriovorax sp.]|nr:hypothetical protein [Halobacteriovorax sp.]|tara:strand:- start:25361 stop:25804 length:444 start_codon:yes stop_codon:yes gene_type:complete